MEQTLYICIGLPASSKSTWAKYMIQAYGSKDGSQIKRVNKDLFREMLDNKIWHPKSEGFINDLERYTVRTALLKGYSVIVDDTNLNPKVQNRWKAVCEDIKKEVPNLKLVFKEFPVTIEEAIKRDLKRPNSVGEAVIRRMANQFPIPQVKPKAIICDLDGTLSTNHGRQHYDYSTVGQDLVNEDIADLVQAMWRLGHIVLFVSGRDNTCYADTMKWLRDIKQFGAMQEFNLFMRDPKRIDEKGNKISDDIIKEEIYHQSIEPLYNVRLVFDDRKRVIDAWRKLGLQALQVSPGDF